MSQEYGLPKLCQLILIDLLLGTFLFKFTHFKVNVFLSLSELCLHELCSLLARYHVLVVSSQALQLLYIGLDLSLLVCHFGHLTIELLEGLLHLTALVEQSTLPFNQFLPLALRCNIILSSVALGEPRLHLARQIVTLAIRCSILP